MSNKRRKSGSGAERLPSAKRHATHVRIIPHTDRAQAVLVSECFHTMSPADLSEVGLAVAGILGLRLGWGERREQIRRLLAPHERRHRREVATILELGLWKAALDDDAGRARPRGREECRVKSGAAVIVESVLPFI